MKDIKFTSKKILRRALLLVGLLTLFGAGLFITNEKNIRDTIADIIVLLVGAIALFMAVLTEAEMERQEKRTKDIHREVMIALNEIKSISKDNTYFKQKLDEELELEKDIRSEIDKISINDLKK